MDDYNNQEDVLDEDLSSLASAAEDEEEDLGTLQSDVDNDEEDNDDNEEDLVCGDSGGDDDGDDDAVPDEDEDGSGDDGEEDNGDSDISADVDEEESVAANSDADEHETAADDEEIDDEVDDGDAMDVVAQDGDEEPDAELAAKQDMSSRTMKKSPRTPVAKLAKREGCETDTDNEFEIAPEKDEFSLKDVGVDEAGLDMKTGYLKPEEAALQSPPRQSKRIAIRRPKSIYDENEYMMDTGKIATVTPSSAPPHGILCEQIFY